jgi:hypothetical protein
LFSAKKDAGKAPERSEKNMPGDDKRSRHPTSLNNARTHLNIRISVQNRGGVLFQTTGLRAYFGALK